MARRVNLSRLIREICKHAGQRFVADGDLARAAGRLFWSRSDAGHLAAASNAAINGHVPLTYTCAFVFSGDIFVITQYNTF